MVLIGMPAALRIPTLALLLVIGTGGCRAGPTAPSTPADQFDQLWATFDREYSYFELKGIDWNAAPTRYAPLAARARESPGCTPR